jgi:hypothetical protein
VAALIAAWRSPFPAMAAERASSRPRRPTIHFKHAPRSTHCCS